MKFDLKGLFFAVCKYFAVGTKKEHCGTSCKAIRSALRLTYWISSKCRLTSICHNLMGLMLITAHITTIHAVYVHK